MLGDVLDFCLRNFREGVYVRVPISWFFTVILGYFGRLKMKRNY